MTTKHSNNNRSSYFQLVIFIYVIVFYALPLKGQPGTNQKNPGKESFAIVVGISTYQHIKPLVYADRDADLFADLLRSPAGGSLSPENITLLKNDSANAGNFWSAFMRICNKDLQKGDRVYIYFAGHGDALKGLNEYYLLLSDCQPANDGNNYLLSFGAIDVYRLKNRIGVLTQKGVEVILILDACRTNELVGGYASQVFTTSIAQTRVGEISMLATGPGQVSIEDASIGHGHGLFTYNLIDALSGRADREEMGNKDNRISLLELQQWVGKKVSQAAQKFRVAQNPVFCCEDKYNTHIAVVDSGFTAAWNQLKQINNDDIAGLTVKTQRNVALVDSGVLTLYNKFNSARKENRLWGDSSADDYYEKMQNRFPKDQLTEDARYMLAADFINFAQQKINLYLEGRDLLSVENLRENRDSVSLGFLSDEYERMQRTVSEKWTIAGLMLSKAGRLLSSPGDSTLFYQMKPRVGFLLARGYIAREKESSLKYEEALAYAMQAYTADSTAAYTAECLGLIHAFRRSFEWNFGQSEFEMGAFGKQDTAFRFFKKAIALAPNWVSPYRSIATKIYGEMSMGQALPYLQKALQLNPEDGTTYVILGDFYRGISRDSAMYFFREGLKRSGKSSAAMIYRKMARVFMNWVSNGKEKVNPDSVLYYSNLALSMDPARIYNAREVLKDVNLDIARAYSFQQKPKEALPYYLKVIDFAPEQPEAMRAIISYYRYQTDSFLYYCHRFIRTAPQQEYPYLEMAYYYEIKPAYLDSAQYYYEMNLARTKSKDLPREKLGYIRMKKNKGDAMALEYFMTTLNEFPESWRPYFNVACYYANEGNTEKCAEYLEKAILRGFKSKKQLDSDRWLMPVLQSPPVSTLLKKYFPGN